MSVVSSGGRACLGLCLISFDFDTDISTGDRAHYHFAGAETVRSACIFETTTTVEVFSY